MRLAILTVFYLSLCLAASVLARIATEVMTAA